MRKSFPKAIRPAGLQEGSRRAAYSWVISKVQDLLSAFTLTTGCPVLLTHFSVL
jgi:hypothetical protein